MYIITIDGPSSSGKSTVASLVAQKLNIVHINSGEAYRAIAYTMNKLRIMPDEIESVNQALKSNEFSMKYIDGKQVLMVNGKDVTKYLHTNTINSIVSQYGKNPQVVYKASDMAREISKDMSVVMEGRNLGSFCFPDAEYKFYVDCDVIERSKRRFNEMLNKGVEVDFNTIYKQTLERDYLDKTREVAPMVVPKGSVVLDSTNLTAEQVADQIVDIIRKKQIKSYSF
ncbi:MAG: (d)CMP kinase [Clostridia bacterium]